MKTIRYEFQRMPDVKIFRDKLKVNDPVIKNQQYQLERLLSDGVVNVETNVDPITPRLEVPNNTPRENKK